MVHVLVQQREAEVEPLIGFFVNPMVLRADLSDNCTIAELIERVRNNSLDAFAHANVPAEMIIDALKIQRNPAYPPLAQVGFAMQNLPTGDRSAAQAVGDISIEPIVGGNALAKYDITLFAQEHNGKIEAAFEYNTDLFASATVAAIFAVVILGWVAGRAGWVAGRRSDEDVSRILANRDQRRRYEATLKQSSRFVAVSRSLAGELQAFARARLEGK